MSAPPPVRRSLYGVAGFNLVSALAGAWGLISGGIVDMGLPLSYLDNTPFASYFWPGVVLLVIVGGTQAIALIAQAKRMSVAWGLHSVAGFGMMIWIFVEMAMMLVFSALHVVYFATGLAQCILVLLALGVWPRPFLGRED